MYTGYTESGLPKKVSPLSSREVVGHSYNSTGFILLLFILVFLSIQTAEGQRKSDIGIIGGTSYYMGDINHTMHLYSPSPAGGLIFRYNFNPRNSIRFHGIYAGLAGDPADFGEPYENSPFEAFSVKLVDVGITTEFNFLPYMTTKTRKDRYSPYVTGGFGYSIVLGGTSTLNLSYGVGFKYNITTRLSTGFEWAFHKTFSDEIDNVQNYGYIDNPFFHNKDWYYVVGIFVTYKLWDWGLDCAAYE